MAKKAEAELLVKIKETGAKTLDKVSKGFGGIKSAALKAGAALGAFGVSVGKLAIDAARFDDVKEKFEGLAESQGLNSRDMLANITELTNGTIAQIDIMKQANNAMLLGLPVDRFDEMINIARGASKATGESINFMLQSIFTALGRQSKLILDNLGIMIDTTAAYEDYAKALGTTADKLSDAEKQQAFINAALDTGTENLAKMGGVQETTIDKWERFKAQTKDTAISIGQLVLPIFSVFLDAVNDIGTSFSNLTRSDTARRFFEDISIWVVNSQSQISKYAAALGHIPDQIMAMAQAAKAAIKFNFDEAEAILDENAKKRTDKMMVIEKERQETVSAIQASFEKQRVSDFKKTEKTKTTVAKVEVQERTKTEEEEFKDMWQGKVAANKRGEEILAEQRKKQREKEKKENEKLAGQITNFTQSGFQGLASGFAGFIGDSLMPGIGSAVSEVFDLLSMDTEEFKEKLDQLFDVGFVENVLVNMTYLLNQLPIIIANVVDQLTENLPEIIESLVEALIVAGPRITVAIIKAFADPKMTEAIVLAVANGVANGARAAGGDISEAFRKAISDALRESVKLAKFEDAFNEGLNNWKEGFAEITDEFKIALEETFLSMKDKMTEGGKEFGRQISLGGKQAARFFTDSEFQKKTAENFANGIEQGFLRARNGLDASWITLKSTLDNSWIGLKAKLDAGWIDMKNKLDLGWIGLKDNLDNGWIGLKDNLDNGWIKLKNVLDGGWVDFKDKAGDAWNDLKEKLLGVDLSSPFTKAFEDFEAELNRFPENMKTAFSEFEAALRKIFLVDFFSGLGAALADAIKEGVKGIIPDVGGGGGGFFEQTRENWGFNQGGFIPGFANGGLIDDTLVRANPGEFVVNRDSAMANADLLQAINATNGRQFNGGGSGGITLIVNGGLLGDKESARELAVALDEELMRLRQGNEARSFDEGIF